MEKKYKQKNKIKYKEEGFNLLSSEYNGELFRIQEIEKTTKFLNKRLSNKKKMLIGKIIIVKKAIEVIDVLCDGNNNCVISIVKGFFKSQEGIKPAWACNVFDEYNHLFLNGKV